MDGDRIPRAAAEGFERGASAYERSRPSYPAEAVACIVGRAAIGPGTDVLDLAAGTGKLTRLLVPTGAEVIAVEPVEAMRDALYDAAPGVEVLDGTAEEIPLGDGSVDVVTVAQAFHWFDAPAALGELRRVLKPGGRLVLVWNTRDRTVEWVRRFGELLAGPDEERPYDSYHDVDYAAVVAAAGGYAPLQVWEHDWEQLIDAELLVARAASVSVVAALPDDRRREVLDAVAELATSHPDLAGRPLFGFPYTTRVHWTTRT